MKRSHAIQKALQNAIARNDIEHDVAMRVYRSLLAPLSRKVRVLSVRAMPRNVVAVNDSSLAGPADKSTIHESVPVLQSILAFLMALAALAFVPEAQAQGTPKTSSASVNFAITVPAVLSYSVLGQPQSVEILGADIASGFVDVPDAIAVSVMSNTRAGYSLALQTRSQPFASAGFLGTQGEPSMLGFGPAKNHNANHIERAHRFGVRLSLSSNAKPGVYPWPVVVLIHPK